MENPLKNTEEYLKNLSTFEVSSEKNAEILKSIENRRIEYEYKRSKLLSINFLTPFIMNAKRMVAIVATLVIVVSGALYYNTTNTYAYHLNKARVALEKLEMTLQGQQKTAFIPTTYAQDGEIAVDEGTVGELTQEVVDETETSIEKIEEIGDSEKTAKALKEVSEVQGQTIDALSDAAEAVEDNDISETVANAIETTADQQEAVEEALKDAEEAVSNGKEEVEVDVKTSKDDSKEEASVKKENTTNEEAVSDIEAATSALEELIASGDASDEEIGQMEAKLAKIQTALEEGKVGRVHGLSTAIQAKARNVSRKAEKEQEKEHRRTEVQAQNKSEDKDSTEAVETDEKKEAEEAVEADEAKDSTEAVEADEAKDSTEAVEADEAKDSTEAVEADESGDKNSAEVENDSQGQSEEKKSDNADKEED